jgi:hypothetical protein
MNKYRIHVYNWIPTTGIYVSLSVAVHNAETKEFFSVDIDNLPTIAWRKVRQVINTLGVDNVEHIYIHAFILKDKKYGFGSESSQKRA